MAVKKIVKTTRIPVNKKRASVELPTQAIPLLLYRRIATVFVILVAAALLAVLYLATMQAVIRVTTVPKEITTDFIVKTVDVAVTEGEVQGEIHSGTLGRKKTVTPTGQSKKEVDGQATGTVKIVSTLSTPQPLVATTRLLNPDGVLFRLKNSVTVPANGSVETEVYADKKGASGNIGPSSFTIPGLNEAKQKLITASSSAPMTGGVQSIAVLGQEEIDQAVEGLKAELLEDAKNMLREQRKQPYTGEAFFIEVRDQNVSAKAGDEVGTFDVELNVTVSGVFYDDEALKKIALRKLQEGLGQGEEFVDTGDQDRLVTVQQVNLQQGAASVHVRQTGKVVTSQASRALSVDRFVGMSEDDVRSLLITEGVATEVDVQFFPFWVRTIPRLKDHIYIEIR